MMGVVAPVNYSQACRSSAIPPNPQSECLFLELTTSPSFPALLSWFFFPLPFYFFFCCWDFKLECISDTFFVALEGIFFYTGCWSMVPKFCCCIHYYSPTQLFSSPTLSTGPGFFPFLFFSFFFFVRARERGSVNEWANKWQSKILEHPVYARLFTHQRCSMYGIVDSSTGITSHPTLHLSLCQTIN